MSSPPPVAETLPPTQTGAPVTGDAPAVSIIVPVVERADDLTEIYTLHARALEEAGYTFEVLFVINAGWPQADAQATALAQEHPHVRLIRFRRNFGESASLAHGFRKARGAILCTLPAYFQVEPDEIVRLIREVEAGTDLVLARRWPRIDSVLNQWQTRLFGWLVSKGMRVRLHDVSCGVRAMRREVAERLPLYGDLHRFIPVLADREGFSVTEVNAHQSARDAGVRVYGVGTYLRRLLDLLTLVFLARFTHKPLRFFGVIGAFLFTIGFGIDAYLSVERLLGRTGLADRPLLLFGTLLIVLGVQVVSVGLIGEIVVYVNAARQADDAFVPPT